MKNLKSYIYVLLIILVGFNIACYEPIANTSGASDSDSDRKSRNKNTLTKIEDKTNEVVKVDSSIKKTKTESMDERKTKDDKTTFVGGFRGNLSKNLSKNGLSVSDIYDSSSSVESRILNEYGSVFLTKATPPSEVMFASETAVTDFQNKAGSSSANIAGVNVELQPDALKALQNAVNEAKASGLSITPRDGKEAAKRSYNKTLQLWNSRFEPALKHWRGKGRLNDEQISKLKSLPIKEQVNEVLELEKKGIYFNTFFNNSILYSVAAPGTSQHISMLAFDVKEFKNKNVRRILAKNGWYRTVQNDEPHFTYLGHKEEDLLQLGLKKVVKNTGEFWIPKI